MRKAKSVGFRCALVLAMGQIAIADELQEAPASTAEPMATASETAPTDEPTSETAAKDADVAQGLSLVAAPRDRVGESRFTVGGRFGDVQEYMVDGLLPVRRTSDSAIFLDLRGAFLEDREQEVNAGVIARKLSDDRRRILGMNVFYDTRWTDHDNRFDQIGAGLEMLTSVVDLRANYYKPLTDEKRVSEFTRSVESAGGTRTTTYVIYEEALEGFDGEIGVWIPWMARIAPTAVYVGYYDFSSDFDNDLSGPKVRVESRLSARLTLDAEWYDDKELNDSDFFVGLRFRLPFGPGRDPSWASTDFERTDVSARMSDLVYRDFRIRTRLTGPVEEGATDVPSTSRSAPRAANRDSSTPKPPPPPPPPNCYLDENGDVICN